jgi:hypothetical protein
MTAPVIAICASKRFKVAVVEFSARLRELGAIVLEPPLKSWSAEEWGALEPEAAALAIQALTLNHFRRIDRADAVYLFNPGGYAGVSTTLELGYAAARPLLVYAHSDADPELARSCLIDGYAKTPEELLALLGQGAG